MLASHRNNICEVSASILTKMAGTLRRLLSFSFDTLERMRRMPARTLWGLAAAATVVRLRIRNRGQRMVGAAPFAAVLSLLIVLRDGAHDLLWALAVAATAGLSAAFGTMPWTGQAQRSISRHGARGTAPPARHLARPRYTTRGRPDGPAVQTVSAVPGDGRHGASLGAPESPVRAREPDPVQIPRLTALSQVERLGFSPRNVRHAVLTHLAFEVFPDAAV